jgi:glycyl-tRNA synthetase beta chain
VHDLAETQADLTEEVKGPSEKAAYDDQGNPTKAVLGFARGQGVDVKDLKIKETPQGKYVFATKEHRAKGGNGAPGVADKHRAQAVFP